MDLSQSVLRLLVRPAVMLAIFLWGFVAAAQTEGDQARRDTERACCVCTFFETA